MTIGEQISAFFKSPNNQTGLILGGSTIAGLAMQYADHTLALSVLVAGVVGSVAKIIQPDNIALKTDSEALVTDGLKAIATKNPAMLTKVLTDAAKVAGDLTPSAPSAPPATPVVGGKSL
jgi:hypothetical protein